MLSVGLSVGMYVRYSVGAFSLSCIFYLVCFIVHCWCVCWSCLFVRSIILDLMVKLEVGGWIFVTLKAWSR